MDINLIFIANVVKGFIYDLQKAIEPFGKNINAPVPVFINSTGDESFDSIFTDQLITKEKQFINRVPRIELSLEGMSILRDQFTNPNVPRKFKVDVGGFGEKYYANAKSIPNTIAISGQCYFENVIQYFQFVQNMMDKISHVRTFSIKYLGYTHPASYSFGDSFDSTANLELSHDDTKRRRILPLTFTIESSYPSYEIENSFSLSNDGNRMKKILFNLTSGNHTDHLETDGKDTVHGGEYGGI